MKYEYKKINKKDIQKYNVEEFLLKMIKLSYNFDYIPEYHYDIKNIFKYYIQPSKNNFYMVIDKNNNQLIVTVVIRNYDKNYAIKDRIYKSDDTASIHRLFVSPNYRRCKIGSKLLKNLRRFLYRN